MNFSVVIIDDDEIYLLLHKKIIEISKFHDTPLSFNSAQKGLDFMINHPDKTKPILLFLDINMPEMNGWDLLEIIHQDTFFKEVYVIMVTSSVDEEDKAKAYSYPKVIEYVEKPFDDAVLQKLKFTLPWL
jgi:CheY-like chemotaxis protein